MTEGSFCMSETLCKRQADLEVHGLEAVWVELQIKRKQTYLPNNLRTFTTKDLLFGCENASEQDNQSLFLQVQDFIVNSGRFP